jgi:hypothetical protein
MDKELGGPQSQCELLYGEKSCTAKNKTHSNRSVVHHYADWAIQTPLVASTLYVTLKLFSLYSSKLELQF